MAIVGYTCIQKMKLCRAWLNCIFFFFWIITRGRKRASKLLRVMSTESLRMENQSRFWVTGRVHHKFLLESRGLEGILRIQRSQQIFQIGLTIRNVLGYCPEKGCLSGSPHSVAQAGSYSGQSSCLSLQRTGATGIIHHSQSHMRCS